MSFKLITITKVTKIKKLQEVLKIREVIELLKVLKFWKFRVILFPSMVKLQYIKNLFSPIFRSVVI